MLRGEALQSAMKVRNALRQKCRTDLLALCYVLEYPDICKRVHGPIIDILQKFPGGEDVQISARRWEYRPFKPIWELEGPKNDLGNSVREILALYPRGHLKTTLVCQAHLIQWIINYPNVRIKLSCSIGDQIEKVIRAVKSVFQYNENFRDLFPEFCPVAERASDFGSLTQFTVPCARKLISGETTVSSITVGKTIAGFHPDVLFHSDLVDKENVKTPGGINDVIDHFKYMMPLTERYSAKDGHPASRGWTYVEGTPYDFGDLHTMLSKNEHWAKVIKPAQENYPEGDILWPERFPQDELQRLYREMGDWMFSAQYLMKCIPQGDGLCDPRDVVFIPDAVLQQLKPQLRLQCTIDLAGMEITKRGDNTVLSVVGFDRDGRPYVPEIHCGQFAPEQVINLMFAIKRKYPSLICFKIEKDAHARVLLPFLKREESKRGIYLTVIELRRDNHTSKQQRIRGLRPWFKNSLIRFSDAIPLHIRQELLDEVAQFPSQSSGVHDDILDTLVDAMQDGEGGVNYDVVADSPDMKTSIFGRDRPRDRFTGFGENGQPQWMYNNEPEHTGRHAMTGVL